MCEDEGCCASWSNSLDKPLEHAVRSRARQLAVLRGQPHAPWRLTHVVQHAVTAVNVAKQANEVLEQAGEKFRIKTVQLEALRDVAEHLRRSWTRSASA